MMMRLCCDHFRFCQHFMVSKISTSKTKLESHYRNCDLKVSSSTLRLFFFKFLQIEMLFSANWSIFTNFETFLDVSFCFSGSFSMSTSLTLFLCLSHDFLFTKTLYGVVKSSNFLSSGLNSFWSVVTIELLVTLLASFESTIVTNCFAAVHWVT